MVTGHAANHFAGLDRPRIGTFLIQHSERSPCKSDPRSLQRVAYALQTALMTNNEYRNFHTLLDHSGAAAAKLARFVFKSLNRVLDTVVVYNISYEFLSD